MQLEPSLDILLCGPCFYLVISCHTYPTCVTPEPLFILAQIYGHVTQYRRLQKTLFDVVQAFETHSRKGRPR